MKFYAENQGVKYITIIITLPFHRNLLEAAIYPYGAPLTL